MKRITAIAVLTAFMLPLCGRSGPACTMIMAARDGVVLAGNNEDWRNPRTRITFVPASEGRHGYVFFGFDDGGPQGGMNDQGLFIDGNAVASTGWKVDPNKKPLAAHPIHEILGACATVADAQAFFETTNVFALDRARFPVADRSGASMVVEHAGGQVRFVRENTWYQVSTNFLRTLYPGENVPCNRFLLASKIMAAADALNLALIRAALSATHQEGDHPTVYSNICDLTAGTVTLYQFQTSRRR
jgi:penicillin V acylase-like amidase (Ntn superfamily)